MADERQRGGPVWDTPEAQANAQKVTDEKAAQAARDAANAAARAANRQERFGHS